MRFAATHPLLSHPHVPELVRGDGVLAVARAAERAGFDGFGFTDHPAPPQRWLDAGGHDALDPFVALGFVAAATTSLRLIPNIVVLPYRNPFLVAKAGASLDVLSGGRFTLAVGAGYLKGEFAALGVDHAARNDRLDDALAVIRAVWSSDDVSIETPTLSARGITAHPHPITWPHPPIWIGGNSARARQRVVEHGDGWCPFRTPPALASTTRTAPLAGEDDLRTVIDDLHARLEQAGRDPASVDVCFNGAGPADPAATGFDAAAQLEELDRLAAMGVTWVQVPLPGGSVAQAVEALEAYGEKVIAAAR